MEMKRALLWYLVIVVVMAGGLYLVLELFVNNSDSTGSGVSEEVTVAETEQGRSPVGTQSTGTTEGITEEDITPGTSPVSQADPAAVPVQTRTASAAAVPSSGEVSGNYTVQVAALASRDKASGVVEKLRNDGFSEGRVGQDFGDALHRVWVGSFASKAEAAVMAERLKGKGYNTYVRAVQ